MEEIDMKKIFLTVCLASFISLTGCVNSDKEVAPPDVEISTDAPEEVATEIPEEDDSATIDASELSGTWKAPNGAPLRFDANGTAESVTAKTQGEYTINGNELEIYWPKNDRTEIYKINESGGKITLVYGEGSFTCTYEKE